MPEAQPLETAAPPARTSGRVLGYAAGLLTALALLWRLLA